MANALRESLDSVTYNSRVLAVQLKRSISTTTLLLTKVVVSIGLLIWLSWRVGITNFVGDLSKISVVLVSVLLGMGVLQNLLFGVRWQQVLKVLGSTLGLGQVLRLAFIGFFFSQALPATVGGDAVRVYYATRAGVPFRCSWMSVLFDRILALFALLVLTAASLPLLFVLMVDSRLAWSVAAVAACGLGGLVAFKLSWMKLRSPLGRLRLFARLGRIFDDFYSILDCRAILMISMLAISVHLLSATMIFVSASALQVNLSLSAAIVLTPPVTLVTMLPISLAGWGVRESAMVVGLAQLGVGSDAAFAVSVLFGLGQLMASLPGGILWLLARPAATIVPRNLPGYGT